jgi:hypothetical protein
MNSIGEMADKSKVVKAAKSINKPGVVSEQYAIMFVLRSPFGKRCEFRIGPVWFFYY